ncbi:epoxyqueuosine reductase [Thermococcus sp. CX2]|uniref:4Fe-4S dicluster domain-containing protein n=1 Tax=Thermococcus sp. CX2 TaxID=163006 RepID=UPI00143876D2|nr:4Fe-4S dicluster domain-containing protein [Thermococcus sp. CX2]NJE85922.1 epoxyqueuosine reductase [Thermococcus sp. CX2]
MTSLKVKLARKFVSFVLPDVRKLVPPGTQVIEPSPSSFDGRTVPEVVAIHGRPGIHILKMLVIIPYLIKTAYYARKSIKSVRKNPKNPKRVADEEFFRELEAYAKELGVSAIGYTEVPVEYIFKNRALLFKNAIVLLMDMRKERIEKALGLVAGMEVWRTYAELSKVVYKLSEFLRERGYAAQPDPPIGGSTNFPLLAQKAGLGYIGKHSLLISERNGPSQRIAAIYTSIENLPHTDDRVDLYSWIPEFCEVCNRCVSACPANAIYLKPKILEDGRKQYVDYKKCAVVFSKTLGCGICIKECTFFKGEFFRIKKAYEKISSRKTQQSFK